MRHGGFDGDQGAGDGRRGIYRVACLQGPGASTERLPIGLQLMRPQGDDDRLLRIALAVEQALSSLNRSQ